MSGKCHVLSCSLCNRSNSACVSSHCGVLCREYIHRTFHVKPVPVRHVILDASPWRLLIWAPHAPQPFSCTRFKNSASVSSSSLRKVSLHRVFASTGRALWREYKYLCRPLESSEKIDRSSIHGVPQSLETCVMSQARKQIWTSWNEHEARHGLHAWAGVSQNGYGMCILLFFCFRVVCFDSVWMCACVIYIYMMMLVFVCILCLIFVSLFVCFSCVFCFF